MISTATPPSEPPAERHESKTKLLEAAIQVIRARGYASARIEEICETAGLTKGSFFHHFAGKEDLAVAAAEYWSEKTGGLFEGARYHRLADPLDRLLAYVDFRKNLLKGEIPAFTCLAGTMVQEVYGTNPPIREACERSICGHAAEVAKDVEEAKLLYAPNASFTGESLALYTQAVIQGAFVLAKARNGPKVAEECLDHLRRYLELLFPRKRRRSRR